MREGIGAGRGWAVAAQIKGVGDEGEAAHQGGEEIGLGVRGESRFRVVRSNSRSHLVPDQSRIFGSRERVGHRSMHIPNARIKSRNGSDP